jgi:hypothetical protein
MINFLAENPGGENNKDPKEKKRFLPLRKEGAKGFAKEYNRNGPACGGTIS